MTKTIACLSNFMDWIPAGFAHLFSRYRQRSWVALMLSAAIISSVASNVVIPTHAADDDDWPEPVYFPQRQTEPPPTPAAATSKKSKPEKKPSKKHGIWPFRKRAAEPASPYPPKIGRESGKQDPPSSPYPLLRLSFPLSAADGRVVPAGIYLLKPDPPGGSPSAERFILLTRENKVMLRLPIHPSRKPDPNVVATGTPSPITPTNPQAAAQLLKAGVQVAADMKSLTITVQEGDQRFESDPIPTAEERRPVIKF